MLLEIMEAEAQGASQHGLLVPGTVAPLRHLPEFATVAHLCRRKEYAAAKWEGIKLRGVSPEESFLAVRFAFGVETPRAITADLGDVRLAMVGRDSRPFCATFAGRALNLLAGQCVREWGLRPVPPTHGGRVQGSEFRAFVAAYWEVDGKHADIDLLVWLLDAAGTDLFFFQPA